MVKSGEMVYILESVSLVSAKIVASKKKNFGRLFFKILTVRFFFNKKKTVFFYTFKSFSFLILKIVKWFRSLPLRTLVRLTSTFSKYELLNLILFHASLTLGLLFSLITLNVHPKTSGTGFSVQFSRFY